MCWGWTPARASRWTSPTEVSPAVSCTSPLGLDMHSHAPPAATHPLPTLPSTCTAGWLATHYLDIRGSPRRGFFELLAHFCPSEVEKEKLTEFTTAEGQVGAGRDALPLMCSHPFPSFSLS